MNYSRTLFISSFILSLLSFVPAQALDCQNGMLKTPEGNLVPSSSCENAYLAEVAASYGVKVSPSDLSNPNKKKDVCRTVYTDNRVSMICERAGIPERY